MNALRGQLLVRPNRPHQKLHHSLETAVYPDRLWSVDWLGSVGLWSWSSLGLSQVAAMSRRSAGAGCSDGLTHQPGNPSCFSLVLLHVALQQLAQVLSSLFEDNVCSHRQHILNVQPFYEPELLSYSSCPIASWFNWLCPHSKNKNQIPSLGESSRPVLILKILRNGRNYLWLNSVSAI